MTIGSDNLRRLARRFAAALAVGGILALGACTQAPAETRLTPALLEDPAAVQKVSNRLEPADRPVFARYLQSRAAAASPLGQYAILILRPDGKDPETVGEALTLTRQVMALEAERDAKQAAADAQMKANESNGQPQTSAQIAAYNAGVAAYNGAMKDFRAKLTALTPGAARKAP